MKQEQMLLKIDLTLASLLAALSSALSLWCSPRTWRGNFLAFPNNSVLLCEFWLIALCLTISENIYKLRIVQYVVLIV